MGPESSTDLSSILDGETMLLFPELSDTLNNGNINKRQKMEVKAAVVEAAVDASLSATTTPAPASAAITTTIRRLQ